jgi:hypothetical protein
MSNIRTIFFILLVPFLLELVMLFAVLPVRDGRESQINQGCEDVLDCSRQRGQSFEEDSDESSFDGLLIASHQHLHLRKFQTLEYAARQAFALLPVQSIGWMMPLRI